MADREKIKKGKGFDFWIIIPAYNAEKTIEATLRQVLSITRDGSRIVVVDDGSKDDTAKLAKNLNIVLLQHGKNLGKGAALKTGFAYASRHNAGWVITLDADQQHDARYIQKFIRIARSNKYDLIIGQRRFDPWAMPLDRYWSNQITTLVISILSGVRVRDSQCGFRAIRLSLLRRIPLRTNRFETESELLLQSIRHGARVTEIAVPTIYSNEPSSIHRLLDTGRFLRMLASVMFHGRESGSTIL